MNAANTVIKDVSDERAAGRNRAFIVNHSGYVVPWDSRDSTVPPYYSAMPNYAYAVRTMVHNTGVPFFTSADNWGTDSCLFAPNNLAWTPNRRDWNNPVFVVGATYMNGVTDTAQWGGTQQPPYNRGTNLGGCVSAFAPGRDIYAPVIRSGTGLPTTSNEYGYWTGSSFSAPLAAAVALRWMERQKQNTGTVPAFYQVYDYMLGMGQQRAPVTANATPGYAICAIPTEPWSMRYLPADQTECNDWEVKQVMPSANNTSGARMIFSDLTCP